MKLCTKCGHPGELSKFTCDCYMHDSCRYRQHGEKLSNCKKCSVLLKEEYSQLSKIISGPIFLFFILIFLCLICNIIYLTL